MKGIFKYSLPLLVVAVMTAAFIEVATGGETESSAPAAPAASTSGDGKAAEAKSDGAALEEGTSDSCLSDPVVLQELHDQKESVIKAQKEIADKEAELKAREQAVGEEMKKLQSLRDEITNADTLRTQASQEKVEKVVETLEGMSPGASAKMITDMDDSLAVEAISRMDTAKLAKVMNKLDSKRAAHLNEILAGVARAKPPTGAHVALAGNQRAQQNQQTEKGGEYDDGQNHVESDAAQRQPSSEGAGKGI